MDRDAEKQLDDHAHDLDDTEEISTKDGTPRDDAPNPPRTTTGKWTSPKFGSAGSGGAELEPGPERD
ncbi:MAG TPA: hypothetical protein VGP25_01980 [Gemmatimonadaceae bacterium]|jgi:hypothetical protein|nr:hypothetical protein [Gemmatimonadaceae bacterium]